MTEGTNLSKFQTWRLARGPRMNTVVPQYRAGELAQIVN